MNRIETKWDAAVDFNDPTPLRALFYKSLEQEAKETLKNNDEIQ